MARKSKEGLIDKDNVGLLIVVSLAVALTLELLNSLRLSVLDQGLDQPYAQLLGWVVAIIIGLGAGVVGHLILKYKKLPNAAPIAFLGALEAFWLKALLSTILFFPLTGQVRWIVSAVVASILSIIGMYALFNRSTTAFSNKVVVAGIVLLLTVVAATAAPYVVIYG